MRRLLPVLEVDATTAYAVPERDRRAYLRLDINEDPRGAPSFIVDAVRAGLDAHSLATYPTYGELKHAVARACGVLPEQVLLCNGGDQGLEAILRVYLRPGSNLLTHSPGFDMFPLWAKIHRAAVVAVDLSSPAPALFRFDEGAWDAGFEQANQGGRLGAVAIVTPNNPTGSLVPRHAIERTLARVGRLERPVPVIVDETYVDFGGETVVDLIDQYPFLFVQRSLSKSVGLAGIRLGYVLTNATEAQRLECALEPFRVNRAAVVAGLAALDGVVAGVGPTWLRDHVGEVLEGRAVLARGLEALGLSVGARDANFLLVHVGDRHTALCRKLEADGILIRDRHGRHPALDGCVRIGIGSAGQVARTLAAVRKALCAPPVLDALIFDLDGTLVDVRASCRRAIVHTVTTLLAAARLRGSALKGRELGLDDGSVVDGSVVDAYKARGGLNNDWDCAAAILADHGVAADYDSIVATHQAAYRGDDWDGFIADEPWLLAPAEQARISAALPLALVTGRPTAEAHFTLARPDCRLAFATVVGMDDVAVGKPDPAGIVMACAALGVAPACVAYIGDAVDDMRAAKAAGAFAIGVLAPGNGHASGWPERLALAGADVICNDVGEVLRWLSQSK